MDAWQAGWPPRLEAAAERSIFFKGCKWSPDGLCLLTATDDDQLLVFNTPAGLLQVEAGGAAKAGHTGASVVAVGGAASASMEIEAGPAASGLHTEGVAETVAAAAAAPTVANAAPLNPVLTMSEGELVYDYCWYPRMSSYDPSSCCLLSTTRDHPLHLWDAFTGALRCTYRAYDHLDEIAAAYSVTFSPDGTRILAGYKDCVRVFDTARPGRQYTQRKTAGKAGDGQRGIVSCLAFAAVAPSVYACGSYSKTVGLYDDKTGEPWAVLELESGVTQVAFSPDGNLLYTGCRQSPDIVCWDVRNSVEAVGRFPRCADTNQKVQFSLTPDGSTLVSGSQDGTVLVYDARSVTGPDTAAEPIATFRAHGDSANGVSVHPTLPLLATASGQRHFGQPELSDASDEDDDEASDDDESGPENAVGIWSLGRPQLAE